MTNIYYTAREGRRNANGHTITRGEVYKVTRGSNVSPTCADSLELIGTYVHQSGGAGIELSILNVCSNAGIDTNSGYFAEWRDAVNLIQL